MNNLILMLCLCSAVALSGCGNGGGDGGGNGGGNYSYVGKTTPALLTASSAQRFFRFLFTGILKDPLSGGTTAVTRVAGVRRSAALAWKAVSRVAASAITVEETIYGAAGGSATYSGILEENGSGVLTISFSSFNSGDGYSYDGGMRVTINTFDLTTETILDARLQLTALTVTSKQDQLVMQGDIFLNVDIPNLAETLVLNIDGRMTQGAEAFRLENMRISSVYNSLATSTSSMETLSGRLYLGSEGYVEISQTTPLRFDYFGRFSVDVPNAGGPLIFSGAAAGKARFTPLSISRLMIEVDSNGDNFYESSVTDLWTNQVGIVFTWEAAQGTAGFDVAYSAQESSDGGTISTGYTNTGTEKAQDVYLVKTDAAGGLLWARTFGGIDDDVGWSLQQTADGGIIIAGVTTGGQGTSGYIIKTDNSGVIVWERSLADRLANRIYSVRQTADGGYILAGSIDSFSPGAGVVGYGMEDMYLVRLDGAGSVLWEKRFGGPGTDVGWSVKETGDGGFVLAGVTDSFGFSEKREQVYLVRSDANGTLLWHNNYGDGLSQYGYDVEIAPSGDLVVTGYAATLDRGNVYYLARVSATGTLIWEKNFGSTDSLYHRNDLVIAADGGYLVAGNDGFNAYLFRLDSAGSETWSRTFNWSQYLTICTAASLSRSSDGGYLIAGSTWPTSGKDFLLIKTDADGTVRPPGYR